MATLHVEGVVKRFGGTLALDGFHMTVEPGEVHGLIGENGSGKSTAMKVISGEIAADEGTVRVDGIELPAMDPHARLEAGVGIVMQDPHLCADLSVAENLSLGRLSARGRWVRWKRVHERAAAVLGEMGIRIDPSRSVRELSQDEQHMVEVARVLAFGCTVIGFDETTASMTEDHVDRLFEVMRTLRTRGAAQVFISHRLPEVLEICDRVTVLRDGVVAGTVATAETTESQLIDLMVGRSLDDVYRREPHPAGDVVLRARQVLPVDFPERFDLEVRAGEVVGLGGLVGSGRSSVLESIFGLEPRSGEVEVAGRVVKPHNPRASISAGMGLVPEDRRVRGLALEQSVLANATMVDTGSRRMLTPVDRNTDRRILRVLFDRMRLKAPGSEVAASTLSGGNQQKIVMGRWLDHEPSILLLDEPTRGIDIGAKQQIYSLIDDLARQGMAILLVSSELPELIGLCDRIIMMREGRMAGEFTGTVGERELMTAAAGTPVPL